MRQLAVFPSSAEETFQNIQVLKGIPVDRQVIRRHRPEHAGHESPRPDLRLWIEVDAAVRRMNDGPRGICEYCHDPIEAERHPE